MLYTDKHLAIMIDILRDDTDNEYPGKSMAYILSDVIYGMMSESKDEYRVYIREIER